MAEEQRISPQDHAASVALELYLSAINALRLAAVTVSPYRSRLTMPGGAGTPCDAVMAVATQALDVAIQLGQQAGLLQAMPEEGKGEAGGPKLVQ